MKHFMHVSLLDDRVEYAEIRCINSSTAEPVKVGTGVIESKCTLSAGASEEVTTLKPAVDDDKMLSSVCSEKQAPIWENCVIYADLKHSGGNKKSSAALRAIQKFTTDDTVLYSEVKHSAANATGPTSAESAHILDNMSQQNNITSI